MLCIVFWHGLFSSAFQNLPFSYGCKSFLLCFLVLHYCVVLQSLIKQLPDFIPTERLHFPDEWNSLYVWHEVVRALWILCGWEILEEKKVLLPRRAEKMPGKGIFEPLDSVSSHPSQSVSADWGTAACLSPCALSMSLKAALGWLAIKELRHKINCA